MEQKRGEGKQKVLKRGLAESRGACLKKRGGLEPQWPPIEGLLPQTGIDPMLIQNSASRVAGLQVHVIKHWKSNLKVKPLCKIIF